MMQIHQKIEQARVSAGLSQEEMAEKLGVKRSTYQYWEQKTPGVDKLMRIIEVLNLPPDYFFVERDENSVSRETVKDRDYKELYIHQLERSAKMEQELKELKESLAQFWTDAIALTARVLEGQQGLSEQIASLHTGGRSVSSQREKQGHKDKS